MKLSCVLSFVLATVQILLVIGLVFSVNSCKVADDGTKTLRPEYQAIITTAVSAAMAQAIQDIEAELAKAGQTDDGGEDPGVSAK